MVKRKEFKPSGEEKDIKQQLDDEESDEIIELEEVVEEPELLPVGDDLDELLKGAESTSDFDFDIEKLDKELEGDLEEKADEEEGYELEEEDLFKVIAEDKKDEPSVSQATTSSSLPSAQEAIDELLKEALLETEAVDLNKEAPVQKLVEVSKAASSQLLPEASTVLPKQDLESVIEELENRIVARFETFVRQQLPVIVLETVRTELRALLKELEEQ
ncbi:MAG: hypothetical protein N2260_04025 [Syntrophobacterales bacterium]|nr:hypothetical protein [Syntrophobacterales bacterium]